MIGREIEVRSRKRRELIDITEEVERLVEGLEAEDGLLLLFVPHTTAALVLNEGEGGLLQDFLSMFERLAPESGSYMHNMIDDNADAHLISSLLCKSLPIPVRGGRPELGTWERVLFAELDGPRTRKVRAYFIKG